MIAKFCFSSNEGIRVHCLGILGEIGQTNHTKEQNNSLLKVFFSKLSDTSIRVICQSLNSIFDTYKDSNWNDVLMENNFLQNIIPFCEKFKTISTFKDQEEVEVFQETLMNLFEFIKYKQNEMLKK
jgi:hypothetical protein